MDPTDSNTTRTIIGSAGLILAYGVSLWRIFLRNRGDRFIETASITFMVSVLTMAVMRIPSSPYWVLQFLEVLLYTLTFLSLFFGLQQGYRALRSRKPR